MTGGRLLGDGRYRLDGRLGNGGMGHVWLAYDRKLDRPVAVKLLAMDRMRQRNRRVALTEDMRARFEKEWQSMARIQSPYVAAIHDRGEDRGQVYLVMEYVDGKSLDGYMGHGSSLTLEQTVRWSVQVCEGLADASDVDVVHRDIKPANIMINERGNAKVVDFGLARLLDMSETHSAGATWQYAAPERWQRSPGDHLSDLYSLGCVMYEMLTGNPPFASRDADFLEVGRMHLRHNPAPPLNIRQGIPEKLSQLVMKLLAKKPEQRPQHARAVIRLIRQVEHTPDAGTDGPGQLEPVGKPHVNTDYVERIREAEQRIRRLLADNGEYHSSVIEARSTLAELTGESGDSRGAADQYETLGEDCKRLFGPTDPRALNAFAAMARWIASPA
ncbi:serine/threonine protein kinase [Streptomyces luteolifulvus]|uniref:non-specific serine/threonine protein kinase n=1 Tax=Streptomyces luteolifulvus TaxID=2615112 RepID=A0A6H9UR68_9ACTN|nr:serine/threonine-protein kinase [Streptomyces luteolifulvus]KAB1140797.1 serine/threonine protein kinase [Streptomyces luteolifulvus]